MKLTDLKWAALSMVALASCGDKDSTDDNQNPDEPQGSGTMEVMTPEESKEYLQTTITDFLDKFNPDDQKAAIELAAYYSQEYGHLEAPAEFEVVADKDSRTPASYLKALSQAAKGDFDALTRAANSYSYTVRFDQLTGIYEPDKAKGEWVKKGNSNDVVFRFNNKASQPVELKVSQAGGVYDVDFSVSDWEWDYDTWEEYEVKHNYYLSIPKNVTVTLTENGTQLANSTAVSNIDVDGHTLSADVKATLMNLRAEAKVSGNDNKIEARTDFYVSGDKVGYAFAAVNGNDLCNKKKYEELEDMDDDQVQAELTKMLKNGDCAADLLGKVQVYAHIMYYKELPDDFNFNADNYDYTSKEEARKDCQDACDRLNKNLITQLRFDNTTTDQASIKFKACLDESTFFGWEYHVFAQVAFPDGTTYDIDTYFENFTNVTNKWDAVIDAYKKIWNSAKIRK